MKRCAALMLAACVNVGFAVSARAAAPLVATPVAATVATRAVTPTSPPESQSPGAQLQRPGLVSPNALTPKVPTLQGTWRWQNPLPDGNPLHAISCPSTSVCFAGSSDGRVRATTDGGSTWAVQTTGISTSLNGISCADATHCVAVGDYGEALHTSDGISWGAMIVNSGNFLAGVSCAPGSTTCFAVGYAGSVRRTTDAGVSWVPLNSGTTSNLFGISCASTTYCVAVGASETITQTADGVAWNVVNLTSSYALFGVSCTSTLMCVAVGLNGITIISPYNGAPWNYSFGGQATATMTGVSCPNSSQCFASGVDGRVNVAAPCGTNVTNILGCWVSASTAENGALFAISCQSPTQCFAAGDFGIIVKTTNGGTGWHRQSPNAFAQMNAISCASTSVCFAVGFGPNLVATIDGGTSWSLQPSSAPNFIGLWGVSCPSASMCFAVGDSGTIVATSDGGAHWGPQTSGTTAGLTAISCPTTSACFVVAHGGTIEATTNGGATWGLQTSGTTNDLSGISCPTASVCYVAGNLTTSLGTIDAGAHWSAQGSVTESLHAVSCPSATTCFADGFRIHVTTNSGATWTDATAPFNPYNAISCASTTVCTAMTGATALMTSDGSTWTSQTTPATGGYLYGVSCPSTTICFAAGTSGPAGGVIVGTTDGGVTPWHWVAPSGTTADIQAVSCGSATTCFAAAANSILRTTNGGVGWFSVLSLPYTIMDSIACPSSSVCFAAGNGCCGGALITATTDGGATWTDELPATPGTQGFLSISCPTTTKCFAVSAAGTFVLTTDGINWTAPRAINGSNHMSAISCPSASTCFVTDASTPGNVYTTADGGTTWTLSFSLANDPQGGGSGFFSAISCPSLSTCYAVGLGGLIATTSDGGANWRTDFPPTASQLTSVTCPSPSTCYATGGASIFYTTNFGGMWAAQFPAETGGYSGVSCVSVSTCFAVGAGGAITETTSAGAAWSTTRPSGSTADILGMSCYGSSNCYAAAQGDLLATHDGGATWTAHTLGTTDLLDAMSCPGISTCFAVGWPGAIYRTTDGGTTWNPQPNALSGADETLEGVSCASVTTCVAVGTDGKLLFTVDGINWNVQRLGLTTNLFGVSCPSTNSCVAVGDGGLTLTSTGGIWNAYASGTTQNLRGVNCPTTNTCYAVGFVGTIMVTTNQGVTWSAQASGTTVYLRGIACTQPTFCVADGNFGVAVATVDGGTWKALAPPTGNALRAVAFPDLNHAWLGGFGGTILANNSLIPSCTSVSVTPDKTSPQVLGTTVMLTAASAGCPHPNPQYRFYLRSPEAVWSVVQDFGSSTTFAWNTSNYETGTYLIGVWVKDSASGFTYDAYAFGTFTLQRRPCSSTNLSPDVASPQPATTTINFTATAAGCPNPLFQWWVRDPAGNWSIAVPFASGNTFAWNTTGLPDGTYQIGVWARQQLSPASYEAFAFVTYTLTVTHCTAVNLGTSMTSPQATGASITLTPTVTGCGSPQYRFYVRDNAGTWHIQQDFGVGATYVWNSSSTPVNTTAAGTFLLGVWAKQTGSTNSYDAFAFITFSLTSGTTCTVNIGADKTSPQALSTTVTWTATATSCPTGPLKYQFWVNPPNGTWGIVQPFSTTNTFAWTGATAGTYQVGVWVKQANSAAAYDNFAFTTFTLTSQVCGSVGVTSDVASPQLVGATVTFTAAAIGCASPQYQWWVRDTSANWAIAKDFAHSSATLAWNTTGLAPGTYLVGVWARQTGSTASYEAYSFITYTLTVPPAQVCSSVNIAPDLASPRAPGTTVTFTATALGCNNPEYRFFVAPPGGAFTEVQAYSGTGTFIWNTSGSSPGPWQIGVWVRQSGSTASYEAFAFITYQLSFG